MLPSLSLDRYLRSRTTLEFSVKSEDRSLICLAIPELINPFLTLLLISCEVNVELCCNIAKIPPSLSMATHVSLSIHSRGP